MKKLILLLSTKRNGTNKTSAKRIGKPSPIKERKVDSSPVNSKVRIIVIETNKSMIIDREVAIGLMREQPNKYKIEEL